jgi:hypothetical protein
VRVIVIAASSVGPVVIIMELQQSASIQRIAGEGG